MATRKGERIPPHPGLPAVSIPGEIPVPEDTDDEMGSGDKTTSPKKARATKTVTLDMDDLKKLLADQVTEISAVQKDAVKEIVADLKGDMERHKEECREHIQQAVDKVVKVEDTGPRSCAEWRTWRKGGVRRSKGKSTPRNTDSRWSTGAGAVKHLARQYSRS